MILYLREDENNISQALAPPLEIRKISLFFFSIKKVETLCVFGSALAKRQSGALICYSGRARRYFKRPDVWKELTRYVYARERERVQQNKPTNHHPHPAAAAPCWHRISAILLFAQNFSASLFIFYLLFKQFLIKKKIPL